MPTKEPEFLMSEYHDLELDRELGSGVRRALYQLMRTGSFTEQDLHTMLRRQVFGMFGERLPCDVDDDEYLDDPDVDDPAPAAALAPPGHRRCPLYERGLKGDPLVPCRNAQAANPAVIDGRELLQAPLLPAGLPSEQRDAINFFFRLVEGDDMQPCRLLHMALTDGFVGELNSPGPLFRASPGPSMQVPAPPATGDRLQQTLLEQRRTILNNQQEAEASVEAQRRSLLLFLIRSGRLAVYDVCELIGQVVLLNDEGFLPCRDPQRSIWVSAQEQEDRDDRIADGDGKDEDYGPPPTCRLCPLQVRAKLGDRAVPCVEALRMAPDPEMIEKERIFDEAFEAELRAEGRKPRARLPLLRSWSSPEEQPGGPKDIVNLLDIRPCHLVGQVAASYLCDLLRHVLAHPEEAAPPQ